MAITPLKMLLFLGGASGAALGTAYTMGAFDPLLPPQMAMNAPVPAGSEPVSMPGTPKDQPSNAAAPAANAPEQQATLKPRPKPSAANAQAEPAQPASPTFDLLRAEPDGSVVIAGRAAPGADVEIVSGGKVIGKAKATPDGDFAAVLDEPLKPGDYQINLRSTTPQKVVADSKETAVVSIPATKDGPVLAMVEQPGAPSRIIARPGEAQTAAAAPAQPATPKQPSAPTAAQPAPKADVVDTPAQPEAKPAGTETATATIDPAAQPHVPVAVEAVEIEGQKLFVAGEAPPGAPVRVYADDQLLGETRATPEGRFLLEVQRDLAVGDYKIRADALAPDGKKVLARAEVGFNREPGETVAAVVPTGPAAQPATPGAEAVKPDAPAAQPVETAKPAASGKSQPGVEPEAQAAAQTSSRQPDQPVELGNPLAPGGLDQPPQLQAVNGGVIIRRGDSLWRISRRVYGRGVRYSTIYLANNVQIRDPNRIYPGQIFRVPNTTEQGEAADMKSIGDQATTVE